MKKPDRKRRLSSQLDSLVEQLSEEFRRTDNPEMMTFRIPTLLEYLMVFLLAKRLGVDENELPNFDYGELTQTALAGREYETLRKKVMKLGEVRNQLAHYIDRNAWLRKIEEFIDVMNLPRPADPDLLITLYQLGLTNIYIDVFMAINKTLGGGELGKQAADFEAFRAAQKHVLSRALENKKKSK
jgi:hypothetical protein